MAEEGAEPPQPAKPILASHLLDLEEQRRRRFTRDGGPERLSSGCAEIDSLLGGDGVERGIVLGISAESEDGRLISLNFLASVLISHLSESSGPTTTRASIVDSTGTFPLSTLADILKSRITKTRAAGGPPILNKTAEECAVEASEIDVDVTRCLEMVGISRIFDVEGLWEVLSEISTSSTPSEARDVLIRDDHETEIADSEDEGEEESIRRENAQTSIHDEGVEIIIVDNMTHIINELFSRKEKSDAHSLLTLLSKTLTAQSQTSNILTILHNTTIPSNPSISYTTTTTSNNPYNFTNPHEQSRSTRHIHQNPSLFPSNPLKPALGQIFTQFPSLHLFLSALPKTTRDAELLYGGNPSTAATPIAENIQYSTVLEILKDETPSIPLSSSPISTPTSTPSPPIRKPFASRESLWLALEPNKERTALKAAFEVKGDWKGLAMEKVKRVLGEKTGLRDAGLGREGEEGIAGAERLTGRGVSNVAKIYGFGGRRV